MSKKIVAREQFPDAALLLEQSGFHPVLSRIYASRGVKSPSETEYMLAKLLPIAQLKNAAQAASILADAICAKKRLLIVADYDSDGATACAVGIRALRAFGADVNYLVPNRFEYGYGLTPEIVRLATGAELLITVDNGIASLDGVAEATRLGIPVLITDHHLPGPTLPPALSIVNPNQPECEFPSKNLAGVGVMFYVMLALRSELRNRGHFENRTEPNLGSLLDLVALGTVADVVKLDENNRTLVACGLKRIREGKACAGIRALYSVAKRNQAKASSFDLGFSLGPRLNAAGRLEDMALGIECLTGDDDLRAFEIACRLDELNRERRSIEAGMQEGADAILASLETSENFSLCLYDPAWHQGVIGILASRIKEKFHRPAIIFARGAEGEIKGSGRSIKSLHLRDALDLISKREPDLLLKFGGHSQAAGLTIREADFERFSQLFEETVRQLLCRADLERLIETDGMLDSSELTLELARAIEREVWGQGFAEPVFEGIFKVASQRIVGEKHLKLKLAMNGKNFDSILFFQTEELPPIIHAVYSPAVNEYNGNSTLQLTLQHWEAA